MAFVILGARQNSHPFQERKVGLKEPAKIGRAVAKCKSSASNLIFDCKVLSRSHAVIWYEDGKFFIQDTKSSNGTYVNNEQVGRATEDSDGVEIKSGDVLQFGVDVTENSKKVTHGCIIATATLLHPDGSEAVGESESKTSRILPLFEDKDLKAQELWQLSKFLQEASNREQMLEQKLATLQRMISNSSTAADETHQAFVKEDELLSRLDILENELEIVTKECNEDNYKKLLLDMEEDKECYEKMAKETIQKLLQEKVDAFQKLADVQRSLSYSEDECSHLKCLNEKTETDLKDLMERHELRSRELQSLQEKIEASMKWQNENAEQVEEERKKMKSELEQAEKRSSALAVQVESLQAECDFTKKQLTSMKEKLEKSQPSPEKAEETPLLASAQGTSSASESSQLEVLRETIGQMKSRTEKIVESLVAHGLNLQLDDDTGIDDPSSERTKDDNKQTDVLLNDDIGEKSGRPVLATCCDEANSLDAKLNLLSEYLANQTSNNDSLEAGLPADPDVGDLQKKIIELNEEISKEQVACQMYRELAEQFQVNFAAEECRRLSLNRELDFMCRKLEDLTRQLDNQESGKLEEEENSNLRKENQVLNDKISDLENEVEKLKESKRVTDENQLDASRAASEGTIKESSSLEAATSKELENSRNLDIPNTERHSSQQFQILAALIVLFIAIGAAVLLDVISITMGNSPMIDPRTWREIYENLF